MTSAGRSVLLSASAVALLAVAGCSASDAATVAVPSPPPEQAALCAALHKELPKTVGGEKRTDPEPTSDLTAGWGDAAIVLRCGVPRPEKMNEATTGLEANGVDWMVEERAAGPRFTTTYREAYVEVTMDERYAHDATPLADLADAVRKTVPVTVEIP
ncbi:DUF3515 domain-containing protein [Streptomyces sp. NPDC020965]|uniref:DUF3515 domain-containing protein n=1 Tax=Streptomyces sp. NPDC020965 TaxID=3365105 RepID=UPI0037BB6708